jgi:hypothetical protein
VAQDVQLYRHGLRKESTVANLFNLNLKKEKTTLKAIKTFMGGFLMIMAFGSGTAGAADVTAGVDVNSAYIWRGITFNDGLVAQPYMDVTAGGFNFNVWGNFDMDDYDGSLEKWEFSEIDLTLSYTLDAGPLSITGGFIEYLFPTTEAGGSPGTREVFVDLSMAPLDGFVLGITGYYDVDEVEDYYITPYIGYSLPLGSALSVDLGASCGYVGKDFGMDSGFHEYTLTLGAGYEVGSVSLNALVGYTDTLDKDVLPEEAVDVNLFGGVGISISM